MSDDEEIYTKKPRLLQKIKKPVIKVENSETSSDEEPVSKTSSRKIPVVKAKKEVVSSSDTENERKTDVPTTASSRVKTSKTTSLASNVSTSRKTSTIIIEDDDVGVTFKSEDEEEDDEEIKELREASKKLNPQISISFERRPVSRPNMRKDQPDPTDLYGIYAKELTVPEANAILKEASDPQRTENPIDSAYAQTKTQGKAYPKDELVSRILALETARKIAFNFLKKKLVHNKSEPVIPRNAKLKDYYIQFSVNGPKIRGDEKDSTELKEAANIQLFKKSGGFHHSIGASKIGDPRKISTSFFEQNLLEGLQTAIAEDAEEPQITNLKRQNSVKKILDALAWYDDDSLSALASKIEKNVARTN